MLYEQAKPSGILVVFSVIPAVLIFIAVFLTDFFSLKPTLPPMYSAFLPIFLLVISAIIAFFCYFTAKDEEPEWGSQFVFKILEGLAVSYIMLDIIILALILFLYFIS